MSKSMRSSLIAFAALALAAAAGGMAYVKRPGFLGSPSEPVKIVDFIERDYPVGAAGGTDVHESPVAGSPFLAHMRQGVTAKIVGYVEGYAWLKIELPDKRTGYVAAAAIPALAPAKGGEPAPSGGTAGAAPSVEFDRYRGLFTVKAETRVFAGPSIDAPVFYPLKPGTRVRSEAKSKDGTWVVAMTEDGRAAYLRTADMTVVPRAK